MNNHSKLFAKTPLLLSFYDNLATFFNCDIRHSISWRVIIGKVCFTIWLNRLL